MANHLDTIQLQQFTESLRNSLLDSHPQSCQFENKAVKDNKTINKQIQHLLAICFTYLSDTPIHDDKYKYLIRIIELSSKSLQTDSNKRLLDDIVEELSILVTHNSQSKTILLLLNRLFQLFKNKQSNLIDLRKKSINQALFSNKYIKSQKTIINQESPYYTNQQQKSPNLASSIEKGVQRQMTPKIYNNNYFQLRSDHSKTNFSPQGQKQRKVYQF